MAEFVVQPQGYSTAIWGERTTTEGARVGERRKGVLLLGLFYCFISRLLCDENWSPLGIRKLKHTHSVLLSSESGSSEASLQNEIQEGAERLSCLTLRFKSITTPVTPSTDLKFSKEIFSCGRSFQAKRTAIWKVVTSRSNFPILLAKVIFKKEITQEMTKQQEKSNRSKAP